MELTEEQIERYSRHILLDEIGGRGQKKLLASSALVVGAGGLGSPALLYLAAAGVGRLGIIDGDDVELSNLHRQIIHGTSDVGTRKTLSAKRTIHELNPDCRVDVFSRRLTVDNARDVLRGYDVVLDGSDNFPTRFLVADCCWFEGIPLVSAAVLLSVGQLMTLLPGDGSPCYRCFLPAPPPEGLTPRCEQVGVLGPVVGVMGTLQALEALKVLLGAEDILSDRAVIYEAMECCFSTAQRTRDPACPLCGENPTITQLVQYDPPCDGGA